VLLDELRYGSQRGVGLHRLHSLRCTAALESCAKPSRCLANVLPDGLAQLLEVHKPVVVAALRANFGQTRKPGGQQCDYCTEHARVFGGLHWIGVNTGIISATRRT
jgi:hypothetical protein